MSVFYEFEEVDTFTSGAVGQPGARVFFVEATQGEQKVAVKCEKQQVSAIAQYLRRVLTDLPPPENRPISTDMELSEPVDQTFVLGPIGLGYDPNSDRLIVQLEQVGELDEHGDEIDGLDGHVRLYVTRSQATVFCDHAELLIASGRPDCRWCELPIDPEGHICPRMN